MHCMIHWTALACRVLPDYFRNVLALTIKVINKIKSSPKQTNLFASLCKENWENFLLRFSSIRWLSKGNMLERVFILHDYIAKFFKSNNFNNLKIYETFTNTKFIQSLAYLANIFKKLNILNLRLQGQLITT